MKVAHFGVFAPNQSGQYETTKELIRAERGAGLDAQFIDYGFCGKAKSRPGLMDGDIQTMPVDWALQADWILRHSDVPKNIRDKNIPTLVCLHGRPENSFLLEKYKQSCVITELLRFKCRGYVTFWDEISYVWENILGKKVHTVPAPVDLGKYKPEGKRHTFEPSGRPNIVVTDMWREDTTPFSVIFAAAKARDYYCPQAKIHLYGIPENFNAFDYLEQKGVLGEVFPQVSGLQYVYRNADFLVTPQVIATRTVREALASGCPIVAGSGNRYTNYTANPRDTEGFANQIRDMWNNLQQGREQMQSLARLTAEMYFDPDKTGEAMAEILGGA